MKNSITKKSIFVAIILSAVFFAMFLFFPSGVASASKKESHIYSRLTDELVALYEEDIAHEPVASNMADKDIQKLENKYGFSTKKVKSLLLLADLSNRVGNTKTFAELAAMRDREIIRFGKHLFDEYGKTLTEEQKKELKAKALAALKSN